MTKENKYRHSVKDMSNRTDLKILSQGFIQRLEREFGFDVEVRKQARR